MHTTEADLAKQMLQYVAENEMSGAALIVRKDGDEVYRGTWGCASLEQQTPVEVDTLYRMASMTKPVTAIAVMTLIEQGKLGLDDPLSGILPQFSDQKVCVTQVDPSRFPAPGDAPLGRAALADLLATLDYVPAARPVTIRDLLSHSSGMGMGAVGNAFMMATIDPEDELADRVDRWGDMPLDFQPGEATGYSAIVNFDILGRVVEVISGTDFQSYLRQTLCEPLGMPDTSFILTEAQRDRLAVLYTTEDGKQIPMPADHDPLRAWDAARAGYYSGAGGLYSTVADYDRITSMLACEGAWDGVGILKPETVRLMHTEAAAKHLESWPGTAWGLGLLIVQNPELAQLSVAPGTYWWSGAFGTHMFIDPVGGLSATFVMNRTNIGGAGSPIARRVEALVFGAWQ